MTPLWLRSARRRPLTVVLLCLLAAVAVMTSALGPLLVRSVQQSTLTDALDAAGPAGRSLSVSSDVEADDAWDDARTAALQLLTAGADNSAPLWSEPLVQVTSTTLVVWEPPNGTGANAVVGAVDPRCSGYVIAAGRCPTGPGQAMVSTVDAERYRLAAGRRISFTLARAPRTRVTVVGVYDPLAATGLTLVRPGTTAGVLAGVETDPVLLTIQQATDLPLAATVTARMTARPDLAVADVGALQDSVQGIEISANGQDRLLAVQTGLSELLDRVSAQARSAQLLILVTDVQVLFLAIFALSIVLQRIGRARAAEWSVGRLRGVPHARWLGSIYAEPVVAILVGLPIGLAAAVGVARLGVRLTLRAGTAVEPWRWPVLTAAVGATVIALAALVAVSLRSIRQPLAELVQQQAEGRRLSTVGAVVHAMVFLLAAATLYQLVTGGQLSANGLQLGLLAPALFALAVAMLTVRLAVLAVRRVTSRPPRSLSALVVGRHAARNPSSLNPALIIAVGLALTVFATQVYVFSVRNQGLRADAVTGAGTVLKVSVPKGVDLLTAVREADPTGRQAMAVKETAAGDSSGVARIVAVDSSRLAAVASWSPGWSGLPDLGAALRGRTTPPVVLTGSRVQVDLTGVTVVPQALPTPLPTKEARPLRPPALVLTLAAAGRWQSVNLGPVAGRGAAKSQRLTGTMDCPDGCRLVALGLLAPADAPYKGSFIVAALSTDRTPASSTATSLRTDRRWRPQSVNQTLPQPTSLATPEPTPAGLRVDTFDREGGGLTSVSPSDTADPLPALLGASTIVEPIPGSPGVGPGTGLDGQQQKMRIVGHSSVLPRALDDGVLVDLGNATGLSDPSRGRTIDEVWLTAGAGAGVEQRLSAQGLQVQSRELLSTTRSALVDQATTRGAAVAVILGSAALALSLLALVVARWADAGRRGADWRALREGGVSPRRLRRLIRAEIAVPAGLAVLVGAISGALAARIAGARLPLVDFSQPGPPLDLQLSWVPVLLLAAGSLVVIAVVAQLGATTETRATGAGR